ncbi:hypothetical protein MML48_1g04187 [Holotrichia oblita]|uniref:Uncharacterized protein n=1 Tax=Holotrichia oblita TaxID=644536 RepID=A0ACB9TW54_HOLOL|nr:hypothetical protein MML48_1g04187 [Holotrichia oblita]
MYKTLTLQTARNGTTAIVINISDTLNLRKRSSLLKTVSVTRKKQLLPRACKLYHIAANLKRMARRLDLKYTNLKERLRLAETYTRSEEFFKTVLNEPSCKFLLSQIRLQTQKPKGRRFNIDDKVLALEILKQSPKGYKLLQRLFALPSRKTLRVTSLPKSASDTADFLLFGDKIFDSVNGSRVKPLAGKTLRCAITAESEHIEFWNQATRVLDSITFDNKGNDFIPPTISNWKTTIRGLKYIWNKYGSRIFMST